MTKNIHQIIILEIDTNQIRVNYIDPNYWNYFNGEKYWLNYLCDEKYWIRMNYHGWEKYQPNERTSLNKSLRPF